MPEPGAPHAEHGPSVSGTEFPLELDPNSRQSAGLGEFPTHMAGRSQKQAETEFSAEPAILTVFGRRNQLCLGRTSLGRARGPADPVGGSAHGVSYEVAVRPVGVTTSFREFCTVPMALG